MVTASRDYVCVRPQTYEDKAEAELLLGLYRGRDGVLVNTVFCVLAPDGVKKLSRAGRSPGQQFEDAAAFAAFLTESFEPYAEDAEPLAALPVHDDLALGLNVAACDLMPLAILAAESERDLAKLRKRAAALPWAEDHVGRQHFVELVGEDALAAAAKDQGLTLELGLSVVQPDPFGRTAKVLAHASFKASSKDLAAALADGRERHAPEAKSRRAHLREADRQDIDWESELPVTDPGGAGRGR